MEEEGICNLYSMFSWSMYRTWVQPTYSAYCSMDVQGNVAGMLYLLLLLIV